MKRILPNDMEAKRALAVAAVNGHFNALALADVHRDAVHAKKRAAAMSLLSGGEAYAEFHAEAEMLGVTSLALAEEIAVKPDAPAVRELERRRILIAIASASSPAEFPAIG